MRNGSRWVAWGLVTASWFPLFCGCATFPPPKEAIPSGHTYGTGFADVWDALLDTLKDLNIEVKSAEKETGKITAEDRTVELRQFELGRYDSKYCYCGSPDRYHVLSGLVGEYTIDVSRVNDNRTAVRVDASYRAQKFTGGEPAGFLPCPSKGIFEPFFLAEAEKRLSVRPGPSRNVDWWKPSRGY